MGTVESLRNKPLLREAVVVLGSWSDSARSRRPASFTAAVSKVAGGAHTEDAAYRRWVEVLGEANPNHRKVWEWAFILQALGRRGVLGPGHRALGFGVGREPLVAALAA